VPVFSWHFEIAEHQQKDKQIVYAQGKFHQIGCQELQRFFSTMPVINPRVETQGQPNPNRAPSEGFLQTDFPGLAVKNTEVKRQHPENECAETNPCPQVVQHAGWYPPKPAMDAAP
jgi:hypothetical protein